MKTSDRGHEQLEVVIRALGEVGVAVSGGVDSMALAHLCVSVLGRNARMFHAVSPAVPADATARVQRHAASHAWDLEILDAGEFADRAYRSNPIDRCYFCKNSLYGKIAERWQGQIASGTNCDDLVDFRPGLRAAAERKVRHPYVEAGIDKRGVRALAAEMGLSDLAELPAQPCLASRVETGLPIEPADLALIDAVEREVLSVTGPTNVRCRRRADGLHIEIERNVLETLSKRQIMELRLRLQKMPAMHGAEFVSVAPYSRGSAFVR